MKDELLYQIAVTMVPNIGNVFGKALVNHFGSASEVFKASKKELQQIEGMGKVKIDSLLQFRDFDKAETEIGFIKKYGIRPLFITDKDYPKRLLNCYDSPVLLYYKGNADLNSEKIAAVVGTRNQSEYGRSSCEKIVEELSSENILIISGLAFGIDTIAHRAALKSGSQTIGVLAHGLDRVYPSENKNLAKQMIHQGGLLTEFKTGVIPDRQNFPSRNRIVAGMSDCVIVIESGIKGGSLITAELANGYNKDVFALPGRSTDAKSEGCNYAIKTNKAGLITSGEDVLQNMSWIKTKKVTAKKQRQLFIELTEEEKCIVNILQSEGQQHIDDIYFKSKLSGSAVAQALLMLEMQNVVTSLPGKLYEIN